LTLQSPIANSALWFTGEDQLIEWTTYQADRKTIQNVAGWNTEFRMALEEDGVAIIVKTGSIVNPASGTIQITIDSADTEDLDPDIYHYTFARTDAGFNQVLAFGPAHLRARVQ
jgi:hypothetical protein